MDINVEKIQQLFKKNLVIPEYQRPYKWTEKNVKQLLDDIWESINASQLIYRIGTVIIHKENDELHIVDGQQRLVTITLVLNFLGDQTSPLLNGKFPNDISKSNIQKNYKAISEWLIDFNNEDKANFKNYLLKNCEFVKIELSDISEAFQLFDSQNARGKALEPYDLLKAFHLREMNTNTEIERMECVENWENAVNEGLLNNLGKYLFRIRKWSGDNPAYEFTKDDIDEFKGINIDEFKDYPYLKPYLLNDLVVKSMSKNPINHFFGADIYFPFQITQMIVNGKLFLNT